MTAITYRESLAGYVDFGADDWNEGWLGGRKVRSALRDPPRRRRSTTSTASSRTRHMRRRCTGWVRCDGLGGRLAIEAGWFNLLVEVDGPRHRHMRLPPARCATRTERPITFVGFKDVHDDALPRPVGRHVDAVHRALRRAPRRRRATRATAASPSASCASRGGLPRPARLDPRPRRARPGAWPRRRAGARCSRAASPRVYAGPAQDGQPDFPSPRPGTEPFQGFPAGRSGTRSPTGRGSSGGSCRSPAGDGRMLTLHHLRRTRERRPRRAARARAGARSATAPACGRTSSTPRRCARRSSTRSSTPATTSGSRTGAARSTSTRARTRSTRSPSTTTPRSCGRCSRRPAPTS